MVRIRNAESLCRWSIPAQLLTTRENALVLYHYLSDSDVTHICYSKDGCQEIGGHHVFHDVQYFHIGKACPIIVSERSRVA